MSADFDILKTLHLVGHGTLASYVAVVFHFYFGRLNRFFRIRGDGGEEFLEWCDDISQF